MPKYEKQIEDSYDENINIAFDNHIDLEHLIDIVSQILTLKNCKVDKKIECGRISYIVDDKEELNDIT